MLYPVQNDIRNKLDLSGIWDFQIDPNNTGENEGWANGLTSSRPDADEHPLALPVGRDVRALHIPCQVEITDRIKWDEENVIAVSVENELKPTRVPSGNMNSALGMFASTPRTTFDFYPFAGLHRPVVLHAVPSAYIEDVTVRRLMPRPTIHRKRKARPCWMRYWSVPRNRIPLDW